MSYRLDLANFAEPMEGHWDGFQRINSDMKSGGVIGVFRQGATENKRVVTVSNVDVLKQYQVKDMKGNFIATLTGLKLKQKGFPLTLDKLYSGELFEICQKND